MNVTWQLHTVTSRVTVISLNFVCVVCINAMISQTFQVANNFSYYPSMASAIM